MPDFTARGSFGLTSMAISNFGDTPIGYYNRTTTQTGTASTYSTANTAIYFPFMVTWPFLAKNMAVEVTTQSGNMDVGIYDERQTRLVSAGSTAVAAAGLQVFNITDTWLLPGTYFMAINCDNTTAAFRSLASASVPVYAGLMSFMQVQAVGAVALPNPATFANYAATRNCPLILVSGASVI